MVKYAILYRYSFLWTYDLYGPVHMLLMGANLLRGQLGGGWALEIETFLGPVQWHRTVRAQPPPICPSDGFAHNKSIKYRVL